MRMHLTILCLLGCCAPAFGKKGDCSAAEAQVAKLTAEVESLKKQLAAAPGGSGACDAEEFSIVDTISKAGSIASDIVQHALDQTTIDDQVTGAVYAQWDAASGVASKVASDISSHPCSADLKKCVMETDIYKTHLAPHVATLSAAAQPHLDTVTPHLETATNAASMGYNSAVETAELVRQHSGVALGHISSIAEQTPGHVDTVTAPIFETIKKASPRHHRILPKKPIDRLLLIIFIGLFIYNFWFLVKIAKKVVKMVLKLAISLGVKLPFKITTTGLSWSIFFGTGFYMCGLCRRRKGADSNKKEADAKSAPKKNGATKPATEKELTEMLNSAKEKKKLDDGVTRLASAAKSGTTLKAPEHMKGKEVKKDVLKKVLAKFKEVDVKKLGL
jgi:hypothetical protein